MVYPIGPGVAGNLLRGGTGRLKSGGREAAGYFEHATSISAENDYIRSGS
jgi:hypothetical protein